MAGRMLARMLARPLQQASRQGSVGCIENRSATAAARQPLSTATALRHGGFEWQDPKSEDEV